MSYHGRVDRWRLRKAVYWLLSNQLSSVDDMWCHEMLGKLSKDKDFTRKDLAHLHTLARIHWARMSEGCMNAILLANSTWYEEMYEGAKADNQGVEDQAQNKKTKRS